MPDDVRNVIPLDYLEGYPFPAFVLPAARSVEVIDGQSTLLEHSTAPVERLPEHPLWANTLWHKATDGRGFASCLSASSTRVLADWISVLSHIDLQRVSSPYPDAQNDLGGSWSDEELSPKTITMRFAFSKRGQHYELVPSVIRGGKQQPTVIVVIMVPRQQPVDSPVLPPKQGASPVQVPPVHMDTVKGTPAVRRYSAHWLPPVDDILGGVDYKTATTIVGGEYRPGDPVIINKVGPRMPTGVAEQNEALQAMNWSSTPLGPMSTWPDSLKVIVPLMNVFPLSTAIWWGSQFTFLYNQLYTEEFPSHPQFGIHGPESFQHLKSSLGSLTTHLLAGSSVHNHEQCYLRQEADGHIREAYRELLWAPLKNESDKFGGIMHLARDITPKTLSDRRGTVYRDLSERTSTARTMHDFERGVLETLHDHPKDAPFALLYYLEDLGDISHPTTSARSPRLLPNGSQNGQAVLLRLAGAVGVPEEHYSAPDTIRLSLETPPLSTQPPEVHQSGSASPPHTEAMPSPTTSFASTFESFGSDPGWDLAEVVRTRHTMVTDCSALVADYAVRVWDELPTQAAVMSLNLNSDNDLPAAVLILGISPRLPYDVEYQNFVQDLRFQMASYLSGIRSYSDSQRRLGVLAKLDSDKSLMFSNVSHELLGPLTTISGPLDDVVSDLPEGSHNRALLTLARRNVGRISRLVSMLIDLSNLEGGKFKGSFERVNLGIVTQNIAGLFHKAATRGRLQFNVQCDKRDRSVYIDKEKWQTIVGCLIENAIKFTPEGSVSVTLEYTHQEALLTVADTGIGISSANISDVVDDVVHSPPALNQPPTWIPVSGTGISLTFAKKLAQLHHGDLEMWSEAPVASDNRPHGTTFRVRIPLGKRHLPADAVGECQDGSWRTSNASVSVAQFDRDVIEDVSPRGAEDSETLSVSSGDTKRSRGIDANLLNFAQDDRVLIVDDTPDSRRYIRSIFAPFCKVDVARDGQEAVEKCARYLPDLIIADAMLPGMDSLALLEALRTRKDQQFIPVILLTPGDDIRATAALKADDYLNKPFNSRTLLIRANMQLQMGKKRRSLEYLFEERTKEMRLLSEHSPAGIMRCDDQGLGVYANPAWREMSGCPVGGHWDEYIADESRAEFLARWTEFLHSEARVMEMESKWKNGRWLFTKMVRLTDPSGTKVAGQPGGIIVNAIDTTERQLNYEQQQLRIEEAEKRRAEAEEARKRQELLIDITSHEIRNPISSFMQCASMVRSNLIPLLEEVKRCLATGTPLIPTQQMLITMGEDLEALESIYQCGLAQERISNDVLSLGKMQLDLLQFFDVETDIRKMCQKTFGIFQNEGRMNRVALDMKISAAFQDLNIGTVMTDPVRLTQIITNLLANGIRFTANSSERLVTLSLDVGLDAPEPDSCAKPTAHNTVNVTESTPIYIFISVSDTGPGLTPSESEKLFERFKQASPETHIVSGGSGLGLFVCRKLVHHMGGRIEVVSEYGKGSEFRFFIKAHPPSETKTPATSLMTKSASASGPRVQRILVVEDNVINRTVLLRQLKHVGLVSSAAVNGVEAVEKVTAAMSLGGDPEKRFDCVIMDLEMPVMNGYQAARKIREAEDAGVLRRSVIIALTGNARQATIKEGMADFDDAVVKPYRLDDLLRRIDEQVKDNTDIETESDPN